MRKIAIIPARSGSKGLKDKNIIDLCGKPLMAYSIEAAVQSKAFERVIVSTDSELYGKTAMQYGAKVMYRGEGLSDDNATTFMVLEDLLKRLKWDFDYFVLLQPTSPLRNKNHIAEAIALFESHYNQFDFLVSVKEAEYPSILVKPLDKRQSLKYFDTDFSNYRRQNLKEYSPNGAIFMAKPEAYFNNKHFFGTRSIAYKMSKIDSIDIDDQYDYVFAKTMLSENKRD